MIFHFGEFLYLSFQLLHSALILVSCPRRFFLNISLISTFYVYYNTSASNAAQCLLSPLFSLSTPSALFSSPSILLIAVAITLIDINHPSCLVRIHPLHSHSQYHQVCCQLWTIRFHLLHLNSWLLFHLVSTNVQRSHTFLYFKAMRKFSN